MILNTFIRRQHLLILYNKFISLYFILYTLSLIFILFMFNYDESKKRHTELVIKNRETFLSLMPKNGVVAEVGVWRGDFAKKILDFTNPKELHLVDPWQWLGQWKDGIDPNFQHPDELYAEVLKKFPVSNFKNVSVVRASSETASKNFKDEYFDWVYIDADHRYEKIKEDLHFWWPKIKEGGLLCGHDLTSLYLEKEITEYEKEKNGVPRALIEFLKEIRNKDNFGIGPENFIAIGPNWAIRKIRSIG